MFDRAEGKGAEGNGRRNVGKSRMGLRKVRRPELMIRGRIPDRDNQKWFWGAAGDRGMYAEGIRCMER
jgi:hypothetical protein